MNKIINAKLVSGTYLTGDDILQYFDANEISSEFQNAIKRMKNYRIMKGNNGKFFPKDVLSIYKALVILSCATLFGEVYNFADANNFAKKNWRNT